MPVPPSAEPVLARGAFRVTAEDVASAWRSNMRWRWLRPQTMTVPVLLGLAVMVAEAAFHPAESALVLAVPLLGVPVLAVAGMACRYALVPVLARRAFRQTRSYREEWTMELTASGSRARAAGLEHSVPWSHYVAWAETDRVILLYHSDALFQFVPKPRVEGDAMRILREKITGLPRR